MLIFFKIFVSLNTLNSTLFRAATSLAYFFQRKQIFAPSSMSWAMNYKTFRMNVSDVVVVGGDLLMSFWKIFYENDFLGSAVRLTIEFTILTGKMRTLSLCLNTIFFKIEVIFFCRSKWRPNWNLPWQHDLFLAEKLNKIVIYYICSDEVKYNFKASIKVISETWAGNQFVCNETSYS